MSATPPDDVAAMFDLPPLPVAAPVDASSTEAAEAALAAEMAAGLESTIESGGLAADAPDSRARLRVEVSWPARMHLPDGRVIELKVRNVSEGGVGLVSGQDIPSCTVVAFEMDVPEAGGGSAPVKGRIKTTYAVDNGAEILCGGTWQEPPAGRELVDEWIVRLRG